MGTYIVFNGLLMDSATAQDTVALLPTNPIAPNANIAGRWREITFYVVFSTGSAAGTVLIETAHDPTYTGTWFTEATVTWAAASSVKAVSITGNFIAMRARISSAITTGTVQVYAVATN